MKPYPMTEDEARTLEACPVCGVPKDVGLIVCWRCFKRQPDGLKWAGVTTDAEFRSWLKRVRIKHQLQTGTYDDQDPEKVAAVVDRIAEHICEGRR